jgi:hypothetical protein
VHVIDAHRWFSAAIRSLRDLKQGGLSQHEIAAAMHLLPNVDVAIQASALVYGRGLIEFYAFDWSDLPKGKLTRKDGDIGARSHFGAQYPSADADLTYLVARKDAIDKHLSHLSELRYAGHPERTQHDRPDWDQEIDTIAHHVTAMLDKTKVQTQVKCQTYFSDLAMAVRRRMEDRTYMWPSSLTSHEVTGESPARPAP